MPLVFCQVLPLHPILISRSINCPLAEITLQIWVVLMYLPFPNCKFMVRTERENKNFNGDQYRNSSNSIFFFSIFRAVIATVNFSIFLSKYVEYFRIFQTQNKHVPVGNHCLFPSIPPALGNHKSTFCRYESFSRSVVSDSLRPYWLQHEIGRASCRERV